MINRMRFNQIAVPWDYDTGFSWMKRYDLDRRK